MRIFVAILILLGSALGSYGSIKGVEILSRNDQARIGSKVVKPQLDAASATHVELVAALKHYADLDFGFQMAVPAGWTRIGLDQAESAVDAFDLGYAVGFEAPRQNLTDQFADYILVEVLPGADSGLFNADSEHRHSLHIDGQSIFYDKLYIDSESDDSATVDLVIFQREFQALGYTVDFYAIGEPANEQILFAAFQIMLRTFEMNTAPFKTS